MKASCPFHCDGLSMHLCNHRFMLFEIEGALIVCQAEEDVSWKSVYRLRYSIGGLAVKSYKLFQGKQGSLIG